MITITVAGGSGSVSFNFGTTHFVGVSLVSPDSTPMYDFHIYDADNHLAVAGIAIDSQKTAIKEDFTLIGICTLQIDNAVDNGDYTIKLVPKP